MVFKSKGRMSHGLDQPIPGEQIAELSAEAGRDRLWTSLETFRDFSDPLHPHFAFWALGKDQYSLAHLMHINNRLEEVRPTG